MGGSEGIEGCFSTSSSMGSFLVLARSSFFDSFPSRAPPDRSSEVPLRSATEKDVRREFGKNPAFLRLPFHRNHDATLRHTGTVVKKARIDWRRSQDRDL